MTPTPVGMRCPECARERTKVKTARSMRPAPMGRHSMTQILIALNVVIFLAETATGTPLGGVGRGGVGTLFVDGALFGPNVAHLHEYYRLLTSGFLHDGLLHILFNMVFLYFVGPALEHAIGKLNFLAIYFASLLAGSFGALVFSPDIPTVGASTALFGLLGALIVVAHYRGISIWTSGLGPTLLINIVFSLTIADVSIGGHLGGFVGGVICGILYMELVERRRMQPAFLVGCIVVAAVSVFAAIAVAGSSGIAPNGLTI
ncbi:MAG TPA: rhomboid family intramembrane serine protease [Solirubrobacteraceae bacterium]|nr:rhomboid family intramembrane serine protease [Solirubrobacteraceae bacterium]